VLQDGTIFILSVFRFAIVISRAFSAPMDFQRQGARICQSALSEEVRRKKGSFFRGNHDE
jgi:hypothetical protein